MEHIPAWLSSLLIGIAGACLAAVLVAGAAAVVMIIYRRYIREPAHATVTLSTTTAVSVQPSAVIQAPTAHAQVEPPKPPAASEPAFEIECGSCGVAITGKPAYSKVASDGVILVYKCPACHTEVGLPPV